MSKFLRITVSKNTTTDLYVEVPEDFGVWSSAKGYSEIRKLPLNKIADETTLTYHWEEEPTLSADLEVEEVEVVDEQTATGYDYWDSINNRSESGRV